MGSRRAEELSLRSQQRIVATVEESVLMSSQQRIVATVEESVLKTEMEGLESQEEDGPRVSSSSSQ